MRLLNSSKSTPTSNLEFVLHILRSLYSHALHSFGLMLFYIRVHNFLNKRPISKKNVNLRQNYL